MRTFLRSGRARHIPSAPTFPPSLEGTIPLLSCLAGSQREGKLIPSRTTPPPRALCRLPARGAAERAALRDPSAEPRAGTSSVPLYCYVALWVDVRDDVFRTAVFAGPFRWIFREQLHVGRFMQHGAMSWTHASKQR